MDACSISVVICAYAEDRWGHTCAAVDSVRAQSRPGVELILVIDHNPPLFQRASAAFPDLRVLQNQQAKGLSGARNTGASVAQGDVVAFLDDDAVAHEDWLKFIANCYQDPRVAGAGGVTLPRWESARPRWLPEEFYWVIGCDYVGMAPSGAPVRNLLGANMSFRREAFDVVGRGFLTEMGRVSTGRPRGCEETEFCIRLAQRAPETMLVIEHRAVVWHFVPDSRCTPAYFVSRCFAEGISKAQVAASVGARQGLSSERVYVARTLPTGAFDSIKAFCRGDAAGAARAAAIVTRLGVTTQGYFCGKLGWAS